ncbi:MAG TPA: hypothetical protein VGQ29_05770 [Gemmatimonadales bacterium]|jgi:hypothetical protein|nr:hypothetical protein [Gemmatimonadales bacterium]
MQRLTLASLVVLIVPFALAAQQPTAPPSTPTAPHDSVRGAIRAVDVTGRTLEVSTGVGLALRVVRLQVPAGVPITDRDGTPERIGLGALKPGDVVRATFGGRQTGFVAYVIERVGRMETGVDSIP